MEVLDRENREKLEALNNPKVIELVEEYIGLMKPSKVYVITDSEEDIAFVRRMAIERGEETPLKMEGHTVHFDSYYDQARDRKNTKILITPEQKMSKRLNTMDREEGLKEIFSLMDGIMKGKEMIVRFFVLGPRYSPFSLYALQITDSWYVAHSEDMLYRQGYEAFKKLKPEDEFFLFVHSAGELENNVTKNIDKRRIYVDLKGKRVLSVNNQYAGNSLGLKKLALRLAIYKANHEDWLAEHMFIMGLYNEEKKRKTFFCGAYPSGCGKTSTAMIPSSEGYIFRIIGDDIAYLRIIDGECRAANIEQGIFGIIQDVNPVDDPVIYKALTTPRELIFSNVLVVDGVPYWLGMGKELPDHGWNHSGKDWYLGKKDKDGKEIPHCHKNARYTIRLSELENADIESLHSPEGVPVSGIFYGGRDSDTHPCIFESMSWEHGVYIGATIESELTATVLDSKGGKRVINPMANMDFLVIPLKLYFNNHKKFGERLGTKAPHVFATNYFLKDENGNYVTDKTDKKIWVLWAEGRIHGDYDAIKTPIGYIPKYEDLKELFKKVFNKEYSVEAYNEQFALRVNKLLEKLDRVEVMFKEEDVPDFFWDILNTQRKELKELAEKFGTDRIIPSMLEE